ncbi:hypothetical protein M413DRAFT_448222 [Hebeloma cylindrosporum]|uniref:Uncharacterized protein n=1 Tax=Hebeloma cylindrosporum TaxID=76867 RepID=A0A0C2XIQ8_HEBCY|nr:hypothetical protein M413DRAFT_448222 [Hebeloma cylindrosporum h7]
MSVPDRANFQFIDYWKAANLCEFSKCLYCLASVLFSMIYREVSIRSDPSARRFRFCSFQIARWAPG